MFLTYFSKGVCEDEHVTPSFIQDLAEMRLKVQDCQNLSSLIPYITLHAARCPGGTCAVPDCSTQNRQVDPNKFVLILAKRGIIFTNCGGIYNLSQNLSY